MTKLSRREKWLYAIGNLGVSIVTVNHMIFLVWFFFPPKESGLPNLIPQGGIFMGLTVLGLTLAIGRIFDAVTDPLIANFSDKLKTKQGKRIPLLKWSALPFALSYLAVFFVPINEVSDVNVIWLVGWLLLSALGLTFYTISYEALLPMMAKSPDEKIDLGTLASALWFLGFIIVTFSSSLWGPLQDWLDISKLEAVRLTFVSIILLGVTLLFVPGVFLKEKDYTQGEKTKTTKQNVYRSVVTVMQQPNYRKFVFANTLYSMSTVIFESGLIYYITILALLGEGVLGPVTIVIGAVTLLLYPLINILSKKKGRKWVLNASFLSFVMTFIVLAVTTDSPSPWLFIGLMVVFAPFAQAGFGILPVVIASDNAAYLKFKTGEDMSAMFMAVSGFFRKVGATLASILLTSLLVFGKDVGHDMGIRLTVIIAGIFSVIGYLIMRRYNEKEVLSVSNH